MCMCPGNCIGSNKHPVSQEQHVGSCHYLRSEVFLRLLYQPAVLRKCILIFEPYRKRSLVSLYCSCLCVAYTVFVRLTNTVCIPYQGISVECSITVGCCTLPFQKNRPALLRHFNRAQCTQLSTSRGKLKEENRQTAEDIISSATGW